MVRIGIAHLPGSPPPRPRVPVKGTLGRRAGLNPHYKVTAKVAQTSLRGNGLAGQFVADDLRASGEGMELIDGDVALEQDQATVGR